MSAINSIRQFIASDNPKELVELGYEIETNYDCSDPEFDTDAFYDNYEISDDDILSHLNLSYNRDWIRCINANNDDGLLGAFQLDRDELLQSALEREMEDSSSDYWVKTNKDTIDIDGFDCKSDGSVTGWEFATLTEDNEEGGISYDRAIVLANNFYDNLPSDYSVDIDCSCHVHVKVSGVEYHRGSYALYMLIIDELSKIWASDDLSSPIKKRIERCASYYSPKENHTDKYNIVRVHPQGTWEFRLFGNTQDSSDVQKCIDSAIVAFRNGYRRYFSRDNSIVEKISAKYPNAIVPHAFRTIAIEAMMKLSTIDSIIESR